MRCGACGCDGVLLIWRRMVVRGSWHEMHELVGSACNGLQSGMAPRSLARAASSSFNWNLRAPDEQSAGSEHGTSPPISSAQTSPPLSLALSGLPADAFQLAHPHISSTCKTCRRTPHNVLHRLLAKQRTTNYHRNYLGQDGDTTWAVQRASMAMALCNVNG